jgi:lipopolysaccharide/colanic/teichoic acid biosynthesis glycosyltransferase
MVTLAFLSGVRKRLRVEGNEFDPELKSLIEAARGELRLIGIRSSRVNDEQDELITEAIVTYVKAEFGLDVKEQSNYREAFKMKCGKLAMSTEYLERKQGGG